MKDVKIYLNDILEQIEIIQTELPNISREEFFERPFYQNAMIRSLEIIGEAAKGVNDEFRQEHADIPWRKMTGMRDKLVHGYASVDLEETWNTLNNDIPPLYSKIKDLLP